MNFSKRVMAAVAAVLTMSASLGAQAPSSTALAGAGPDRYAPFSQSVVNGFHGLDDVFRMEINSSGAAANRPPAFSSSFYDWQGVQAPLDPTGISSVGKVYQKALYIDPAYLSLAKGALSVGIWLRTNQLNTDNEADARYSIIDLTNENGFLEYKHWDDNIGWIADPGVPVVLDSWAVFSIAVSATSYTDEINGVTVFNNTPIDGAIRASTFFVEAHNAGVEDVVMHLASVPSTSAAPEPGTLALFATGGFGLLGIARRRRLGKETWRA